MLRRWWPIDASPYCHPVFSRTTRPRATKVTAVLRWNLIPFAELTVQELYDLLALRQLVFSVEQKCAYLDCDGKDQESLHLLGRDESGRLVAYARLVPAGVTFEEPSIGRVVNHPDVRRAGVGRELMKEAIARAERAFGARPIRIGAQLYLKRFYEELGFAVAGAIYDEDGIPHVQMLLAPSAQQGSLSTVTKETAISAPAVPLVRRVALGDQWLAVHESGEGEPVVLVHSGGFSARQWRKLGETLATTHQVLAPDLLGYGASSPWPVGAPFHLRQDLAALEALAQTLDAPAHWVGHSYGGLLALKVALSCPSRVRSLALFEPVAFGVLDEPADAEARASLLLVQDDYRADADGGDDIWLGKFVEWWNGPGAWNGLGAEARATFGAVGWKVYQEVLSIGADRTDRATFATIAVPTLVLGGGRTPRTERRVIEKLAAALPHAKLEVFPEMGHMGPITHAAIVNQAIAAHIRANSGS